MKTLEEIVNRKTACLDGRDVSRLIDFLPVSDWDKLGLTPADNFDASTHVVLPLTEESVKKKLAGDLAFGFEKALNKRGISSSMMYEVVKMWMWVLDDNTLSAQNQWDYAQYGLPFFKAVAVKYGLPNPIGNDNGDEEQYASD